MSLDPIGDPFTELKQQMSLSQIGRYVLMPGDPNRAGMIAEMLESPQKVGRWGGLAACSGWLSGVQVFVVSSGIGGRRRRRWLKR